MNEWWNVKENDMMQYDLIADNDDEIIADNDWEEIIINSHWWEWWGFWNNEKDESSSWNEES